MWPRSRSEVASGSQRCELKAECQSRRYSRSTELSSAGVVRVRGERSVEARWTQSAEDGGA